MSNRIYESFLKSGLPLRPDGKSYSPTAYNIYRTICYRYDEKKGYAYPGEEALLLATGVSRQSVNRAVKELKNGGVLAQISKGYRNQRAEYAPIFHVNLLAESDKPSLHIREGNESSLLDKRDNLEDKKGKENALNESSKHVTISLSSSKSSKREDLFRTVLSFVPTAKRFIPGDELIALVEELEHRGTSLQAIEAHFRPHNLNLINNPEAFITKELRNLVALPVRYSADHRPPKCANPECDEETRTLPYPVEVPNGNGQTTRSCLECNHYWVNKRNGF